MNMTNMSGLLCVNLARNCLLHAKGNYFTKKEEEIVEFPIGDTWNGIRHFATRKRSLTLLSYKLSFSYETPILLH